MSLKYTQGKLITLVCLAYGTVLTADTPIVQEAKNPPEAITESATETSVVESNVGRFSGFLIGGSTLAPKSDHTLKTTSGTTLTSGKSTDSAALLVGVEGLYQPVHYIAFSLQLSWSKFSYKDNSPSDTHMSYLVIPKIREDLGGWIPWAGLGIGLMSTSIGQTSETVSGITMSLDSSSSTDLVISPRIGSDFRVGERLLLGIEAGYTTFSTELNISLVQGTSTAKVIDSLGRSWYNCAARVGVVF